jgi:hypothetical protein
MMRLLFILMAMLILKACQLNQHDDQDITVNELKEAIHYLASEELEGRKAGSAGGKKAAAYMLNDFRSNDLELFGEDGKQTFDVVLGYKLGKYNSFSFNNYKAKLKEEFIPFPFSDNGPMEEEVVFAGYGFNIQSEIFRWNDYQDINPKGKWVLIFQGTPDIKKYQKMFGPRKDDRSKAEKAKELGAKGVLIVSDQDKDEKVTLANPSATRGNIGIPAINITPELADKILKSKEYSVKELKSFYNKEQQPKSFNLSIQVKAEVDRRKNKGQTQNAIARLPVKEENNSDKYIVVGAHYDHLGYGGPGSGSRRPDTNAIHYGADDNASGIAAMLEIAEKLETIRDSLTKNVIFIGFGAEELGLFGSKYFINNTDIHPEQIEAMINIDMIGRLRDENSLQISGTGTSKEADSLLNKYNQSYNFKLGLSKEGYGPSDHSSFYSRNIPVFFFSTGPHLDYHTPKDTPSEINYKGLQNVTEYIYDLTKNLATTDMTLTFQEAGSRPESEEKQHREDLKVTLGIMPDFAGVVDRGLRADLVIKGKPADRAGMKKGDIITAINGHEIGDIYDYMNRLSKIKPGQTITVEILRDGKSKVLMVQL